MSELLCPVCGNELDKQYWFDEEGVPGVTCDRCGFSNLFDWEDSEPTEELTQDWYGTPIDQLQREWAEKDAQA